MPETPFVSYLFAFKGDLGKIKALNVILPEKKFSIAFSSDMEAVKREIKNRFENDGSYRFSSSFVSEGNRFCISKKPHILNPLKRKVVLAEVRGEITDKVVNYKFGISPSMKFIFLLDIFFLAYLALGYFDSDELQAGFTLLAIILASFLFFRFKLKHEFNFLEGELQNRLNKF